MKQSKYVALAIAVLMILAACTGGLHTSIWATRALEQMEGNIQLPNGVYTGSAQGFYGPINVAVTIEDNAIVNIEVVSHSDTAAFASSVFGSLIPAMMAWQSTGVDTVAGATLTADGLIHAVEDALVSGGANLADLRATPTGGAGAAAAAPAVAAVATSPHGPFNPGTYIGVGGGYATMEYGGPDLSIAVTFDTVKITAIDIVESGETPMFADMAFNTLIPNVLNTQTYEVDIVSGVTLTSFGFMFALMDAVFQAGGW